MGSYNSDGDGEEIGAYAKHWEWVGDVSPLPIAIPNGSDNINCGWMKSECKEEKQYLFLNKGNFQNKWY